MQDGGKSLTEDRLDESEDVYAQFEERWMAAFGKEEEDDDYDVDVECDGGEDRNEDESEAEEECEDVLSKEEDLQDSQLEATLNDYLGTSADLFSVSEVEDLKKNLEGKDNFKKNLMEIIKKRKKKEKKKKKTKKKNPKI